MLTCAAKPRIACSADLPASAAPINPAAFVRKVVHGVCKTCFESGLDMLTMDEHGFKAIIWQIDEEESTLKVWCGPGAGASIMFGMCANSCNTMSDARTYLSQLCWIRLSSHL